MDESKFSLHRARCCFCDEPMWVFFFHHILLNRYINSLLELRKEMKFVCLFV